MFLQVFEFVRAQSSSFVHNPPNVSSILDPLLLHCVCFTWSVFVFVFNSTKESGLSSHSLSFKYGDILHVTNASDDEWWQTRQLLPPDYNDGVDIIPSRE